MLQTRRPCRQRSSRCPFRAPPWHDGHPDCRRIDADLPLDHHARWLAAVVTRLDLGPLRRSYANRGALAYPVEQLLAFVLFMYALGLLSPAQWAEQARYDDRSKWLLRGLRPCRSQLYAFRDRLEPFLDAWHQQILAWAVAEGITAAARASLDGTFVAALASRHQLMGPRRVDRRLLLLRLLVWLEGGHPGVALAARLQELPELVLTAGLAWLTLLGEGVAAAALLQTLLGLLAVLGLLCPAGAQPGPLRLPAWVPASKAGRRRVLTRYQEAQRRLADKLRPYQQKQKLSKKDQQAVKRLKVSLTDPEAALGWDKLGTFRPLYDLLLVQACDAPLTLAFDVLPRGHDGGLLPPLLEQAHAPLGRPLQEVLVDDAFVSVADAVWCEQHGIVLYAPADPPPAAPGEGAAPAAPAAPAAAGAPGGVAAAATAGGKAAAGQEAKLAKSAFRYDSVAKVYVCPQGKVLAAVSHTTEKRANGLSLPVVVHRADGRDCQACPQRQGCTSNPAKGRVVKRYEGEEALERLRARMAEPGAQQVYRQRGQSVELGDADLKEHRGLRVFRCFGQQRARTQAGLVILASNGLTILRTLHRRGNAGPPPPAAEKRPA
jgi:transposase